MEKIAHEMRAWGFEEKSDFKGLIPTVNENLPVIGEELEVTDIDAIVNEEESGSGKE